MIATTDTIIVHRIRVAPRVRARHRQADRVRARRGEERGVMEPVGEYLCRNHNPDDTAARKLQMVECIHPFADLVDALLRSWAMHAGIHDTAAECGGEG